MINGRTMSMTLTIRCHTQQQHKQTQATSETRGAIPFSRALLSRRLFRHCCCCCCCGVFALRAVMYIHTLTRITTTECTMLEFCLSFTSLSQAIEDDASRKDTRTQRDLEPKRINNGSSRPVPVCLVFKCFCREHFWDFNKPR